MSLSKVWVYAEASEGKPTTLTLELLTKARRARRLGRGVLRGRGRGCGRAGARRPRCREGVRDR